MGVVVFKVECLSKLPVISVRSIRVVPAGVGDPGDDCAFGEMKHARAEAGSLA